MFPLLTSLTSNLLAFECRHLIVGSSNPASARSSPPGPPKSNSGFPFLRHFQLLLVFLHHPFSVTNVVEAIDLLALVVLVLLFQHDIASMILPSLDGLVVRV